MTIKMKNIISITEARNNIFEIAEKMQRRGNHYIFTENGKPKIAAMSADEYDSLMEDLFLENDPKFAESMRKADEAFARGDVISLEEMEKKLGWPARNNKILAVADKSKKTYKANKKKK